MGGCAPPLTRRTMPFADTSTSFIRRRRVTKRGEPGGRVNPSVFKAFANASKLIQRDVPPARRASVALICACEAACASSSETAGGGGALGAGAADRVL